MNPLRLLIVTRRFWPMSGPVELAVGDLAGALQSLGHQVQIVTSRWGKNWPARCIIREIPVHRITRPTSGPWASFRFQRALTRFASQSFDEGYLYDGIIVFGLGQETDNLLRLIRSRNVPTKVLTHVDPNINPYHVWNHNSIRRVLFGLDKVTAIVADSELTKHQLVRFDVNADKIHVVHHGVGGKADVDAQVEGEFTRSRSQQISARRALSDAHPVLSIEPDQPLIVSAAAMDSDNGLIDLVDAWPTILNSYPQAKLWLLGDGSHGQQVWDAITSRELVRSVIMPGYFDCLDQVFGAADLYVHPLRTDAACSGLTRAMASGLCPVATVGAFSDKFVEKNKSGVKTVSGNSKALAEAILHGLDNSELRSRLGNKARKHILARLPVVEQAKTYVKLVSKQADPVIQNVH